MIITAKDLKAWKACKSQSAKFNKMFPKGLKATKKNCMLVASMVYTDYVDDSGTVSFNERRQVTWADSLLWYGFPGLTAPFKHYPQAEEIGHMWKHENKILSSWYKRHAGEVLWEVCKRKGWDK